MIWNVLFQSKQNLNQVIKDSVKIISTPNHLLKLYKNIHHKGDKIHLTLIFVSIIKFCLQNMGHWKCMWINSQKPTVRIV